MSYGPLYQSDYRPKFSGHETFPLRYGWLKKVFDRVSKKEQTGNNGKNDCWRGDAVADFGVGKNMVASMRHWSTAVGVIEESKGKKPNAVVVTEFGKSLLGSDKNSEIILPHLGDSISLWSNDQQPQVFCDPYLEDPSSLWIIHWCLASRADKTTTWFWAFNHFQLLDFERDDLCKELARLIKERNWPSVAETTIKNDISCFIRTYVASQSTKKIEEEDTLESPLIELGLIQPAGKKDSFRFSKGPKLNLTKYVFALALSYFWAKYDPTSTTLSFEAIAYAPGSPGKVFLLDENSTADYLTKIESDKGSKIRWSETAGLKQIVRETNIN